MTIHCATASDHHDDIPWLRADNPDQDQHCVIETAHGVITGAALRTPNPLHPGLDNLELAVVGAATPELLDAITARSPRPCLLRSLPGSDKQTLALRAGATVFERVPASLIDPSEPEIMAWAAAHAGPTTAGSEATMAELTDLWIAYYVSIHQHFGTTQDRQVLEKHPGGFVSRALDPQRTQLVVEDGRPVAAAFMFTIGDERMALVDALPPEHPRARAAVETAMAALIRGLDGPIELDGHASGRHYPAVLASIPRVTAGRLTPMEILRLDARP